MKERTLSLAIAMAMGLLAACDSDPNVTAHHGAPALDVDTVQLVHAELDINGDGTLSRTEAEALAELDGLFDQIDSDDDNRISSHELSGLVSWDGVLEERQFALLSALESRAMMIERNAATVSAADPTQEDPLATDDFESTWPPASDSAITASGNPVLAAEGASPSPRQDHQQTLDPTREVTLATSGLSQQPGSDASLDPAEDTALNNPPAVAEADDSDESTAQAAIPAEGDTDVDLSEVRLNAQGALEELDGDTPLAVAAERIDAIFRAADADGDSRLLREETGAIAGLSERFSELDTDHDGTLDRKEFGKLRRTV